MAASHALILDPDMQQLLNRLATNETRSPEFVVRDALMEYAARHDELTLQDRQAIEVHDALWDTYDGPRLTEAEFLAEAEASWQHYKETGLHLTHEEVGEWVERLRTDPNAKLPACHT